MMKVFFGLCISAGAGFLCAEESPKNVILIIGDGAGYGSWETHRAAYALDSDSHLCAGSEWLQLSCSTFPLNRSPVPLFSGQQDSNVIYDPDLAWGKDTKISDVKNFPPYRWLKKTWTDSAASATALSSGSKTYNSSINRDDFGRPLLTLAEHSKQVGRSVGIITTVEISHATPAAFGGAHQLSRELYSDIAAEILADTVLDVWMGAGHPFYDNDGRPIKDTSRADYRYLGGKDNTEKLLSGTHPGGWKFIEKRSDFQKMISDAASPRVLGVFQAHETRDAFRSEGLPRLETVPTLPEMSLAALNLLDNNPHGFFLMIEAGAIDWMNHANHGERMIEEFEEMVQTVNAVSARLDRNEGGANWENTLVIVTADHETGLLLGRDSDKHPFSPILPDGKGKAAFRYHSDYHSNMLVPVRLRGAGASGAKDYIRAQDPVRGPYLDNTDLFQLMKSILSPNS